MVFRILTVIFGLLCIILVCLDSPGDRLGGEEISSRDLWYILDRLGEAGDDYSLELKWRIETGEEAERWIE